MRHVRIDMRPTGKLWYFHSGTYSGAATSWSPHAAAGKLQTLGENSPSD